MSMIFSLNPVITEQERKAQKTLQRQALEEIKASIQESSFDKNNSIWKGGEYSNDSYGYGVENFGEWHSDITHDGGEEEFLRADEVCFLEDLIQQFNKKYPTLDCGWQEDSAKMITIYVGSRKL